MSSCSAALCLVAVSKTSQIRVINAHSWFGIFAVVVVVDSSACFCYVSSLFLSLFCVAFILRCMAGIFNDLGERLTTNRFVSNRFT